MSYAAGVLVLAWHNGHLLCLLGKDHYNTYSDFGGKEETCDMHVHINTAAREMYEETCGVVQDIGYIKENLKQCSSVEALSYTNKPYYMYIMFVNFDTTFSPKFSYAYNYIRHVPRMNKFTEKQSMSWFSFNDLCAGNVALRNIFQRTLAKHKNSILRIAYNYLTTNCKYYNGRHRILQ